MENKTEDTSQSNQPIIKINFQLYKQKVLKKGKNVNNLEYKGTPLTQCI